jgi:hypothetical protein
LETDLFHGQFPDYRLKLEIGGHPEKQAGSRAIQDFTRLPVFKGHGHGFA